MKSGTPKSSRAVQTCPPAVCALMYKLKNICPRYQDGNCRLKLEKGKLYGIRTLK